MVDTGKGGGYGGNNAGYAVNHGVIVDSGGWQGVR